MPTHIGIPKSIGSVSFELAENHLLGARRLSAGSTTSPGRQSSEGDPQPAFLPHSFLARRIRRHYTSFKANGPSELGTSIVLLLPSVAPSPSYSS